MNALDRIVSAIGSELASVGGLEDITRVLLRLLTAALLGAVLGLEREMQHKSAGLRTHMLVSLGSALFVLIAWRAGFGNDPLSRVVQGVAAGIGFLCAGAILRSQREEHVHGLTTAAGLWITTAVGLAAGLGHELLALFVTLLALGILRLEGRVKRWLGGGSVDNGKV